MQRSQETIVVFCKQVRKKGKTQLNNILKNELYYRNAFESREYKMQFLKEVITKSLTKFENGNENDN